MFLCFGNTVEYECSCVLLTLVNKGSYVLETLVRNGSCVLAILMSKGTLCASNTGMGALVFC